MSFKRVVLLQKEVEADAIWNRLPVQYDAQTYQLVTVSLDPDEADAAADYVLAILDEIGWEDTVVIAHETDSRLAQEVAARVPERISGLFLVDPPTTSSDFPHPSIIPTLIWRVSRSRARSIPAANCTYTTTTCTNWSRSSTPSARCASPMSTKNGEGRSLPHRLLPALPDLRIRRPYLLHKRSRELRSHLLTQPHEVSQFATHRLFLYNKEKRDMIGGRPRCRKYSACRSTTKRSKSSKNFAKMDWKSFR